MSKLYAKECVKELSLKERCAKDLYVKGLCVKVLCVKCDVQGRKDTGDVARARVCVCACVRASMRKFMLEELSCALAGCPTSTGFDSIP